MDRSEGSSLSRDAVMLTKEYLAQDLVPSILGVTGVFCFLSLIIVSLRLYARAFMVRRLGWEDLLIFITGLFVLGCWICFVGESKTGVLGRHMETVTIPQYERFLLWTFPHQLFLSLGVGTFKCSVGFFLIRVAFITICSLVYASTLFWACIPLRANWHLDEQKDAKMISTKVWMGLAMWNSISNMLTDSILALWPMPLVLRMRVSTFKKAALVAALSLGWLAVVCGAVKTWAMWNYFSVTDKYYKDQIRRSSSSKNDSGKIVLMPPVVMLAKPAQARIRRPIITWTGMGFTSFQDGEEFKYDDRERSGSRTALSFAANVPDMSAKYWYTAASYLGCGNYGDVIPCMRSKNMTDILEAAAKVPYEPTTALYQPVFHPTIDNQTVFADYASLSANGNFARIPYLAGNVDYEAGFYKLAAWATNRTLTPTQWDNFILSGFTCPNSTETANRAKYNVPTWQYRYFGEWKNLRLM
ncbi:unnamed protein product [Aureobasidium mustum]|uniref:Rhodopsin domain-containing protein n=1 Tax=Aureobasidium mustum TaxID=2773714 RepID=A0A9N8JYN3_9PEZI|nr:unnamed protein product [Aureobasidium mustum]